MIDISKFYAYRNYLRSCFKFPRAENRAPCQYMHLVNILRIITFSFLVGHSILTISDFNIQGESKKSDAFCYSNLPRVTCC